MLLGTSHFLAIARLTFVCCFSQQQSANIHHYLHVSSTLEPALLTRDSLAGFSSQTGDSALPFTVQPPVNSMADLCLPEQQLNLGIWL